MSDVLVALEEMLPDLPIAVDQRRLGDRLNQAIDSLKAADHHRSRLTALLDLAELTAFESAPIAGDMLADLQEEAYGVGEGLEAANTEGDLRDALDEYERGFQRSLANVERTLRTHWATMAVQKFRSLGPLGDLLQRIGVAPDLARRLQECGRRGLERSDVGPLTELAARARDLLSELEALQAERATAIGAGDVGDFVNALADHRATLAHITPEVRAWLDENQALERFAVSPR